VFIPSTEKEICKFHGIQGRAIEGILCLRYCALTGSGSHLASYSMGTRGSFHGGEADHSPPTSAEGLRMRWALSLCCNTSWRRT